MRREYPTTPVIAVGTIIIHQDRLVLVRRAKEPSKGRWTFPGGAVELGESLADVERLLATVSSGSDASQSRL